MPDIQYKRLTRASTRDWFARAARSRASLWLGSDHLLSVESGNFRESYKRFYFRDIQAIVVQKTKVFQVTNMMIVVLGVGAILSMIGGFISRSASSSNVAVNLGIFTGLFGLILLPHLTSGPTCKTFLRTAVQIEELPSLCRVKRTRRVLVEIYPLIVAAQGGELSPETVAAQMREWTAPTAAATTTPMATTTPPDNAQADPNVPPRLNP